MMSNETKRNVFEAVWNRLAGYQVFFNGCPRETLDGYKKRYDNALPDDLPVIPELIGKYLRMRKRDHGNLVQALDEGTSVVLDGTKWESVQDWFSDAKDSFDTFARAWVLGAWKVEETGEIVKLEAEK